jgi:DivIVA domain-containing protein
MLTLDEIEKISFRRSGLSGGYKIEEVDSFVEGVIETVKTLEQTNKELEVRVEQLNSRLIRYEENAASVQDAIITAEITAKKLVRDANENAEKTIRDANEQAERTVFNANQSAEKTINDANAQAEKTLAEADESAEKTISDAHERAEQILEEATESSDKTIIDAYEKADSIIGDANDKAAAIENDAYERGSSFIYQSEMKAETILNSALRRSASSIEENNRIIEQQKTLIIQIQSEVTRFRDALIESYKTHLKVINSLPREEEFKAYQSKLDESYPTSVPVTPASAGQDLIEEANLALEMAKRDNHIQVELVDPNKVKEISDELKASAQAREDHAADENINNADADETAPENNDVQVLFEEKEPVSEVESAKETLFDVINDLDDVSGETENTLKYDFVSEHQDDTDDEKADRKSKKALKNRKSKKK